MGSGDPTDSGEYGELEVGEGAGSMEGSIFVEAIGITFSNAFSFIVCRLFAEAVDWRHRFIGFVHESAERCHVFTVFCWYFPFEFVHEWAERCNTSIVV